MEQNLNLPKIKTNLGADCRNKIISARSFKKSAPLDCIFLPIRKVGFEYIFTLKGVFFSKFTIVVLMPFAYLKNVIESLS